MELQNPRRRSRIFPIISIVLVMLVFVLILNFADKLRQLAPIPDTTLSATYATSLTPEITCVCATTPTFTLVVGNAANSNTITPISTQSNFQKKVEEENAKYIYSLFVTCVVGLFAFMSFIGIILFRAWGKGRSFFPSKFISNRLAKSFLAFPAPIKWALFIGYKKYLLRKDDVRRAANEYFGIPAIGPNNQNILPDETGNNLHLSIEHALLNHKYVVVIAKGGGGKTTLLARWSYLCINNKLPTLKGFIPIMINSTDYRTNLIESIALVLRGGYGIPVEKEYTQSLLETGKFLILVDGVSEIKGDKDAALEEILRIAQSTEYKDCRFLISTRPGLNIPQEATRYYLQPLNTEVAENLLKLISKNESINPYIRRQLEYLGPKPIEPLLFSMILQQGQNSDISYTRAQLYKEYFKRVLRIHDEDSWVGWNVALEHLAKWFSLDTGLRGVGLVHERLIDLMSEKTKTRANLIDSLNHYYQLALVDPNSLLRQLASSGIIQQNGRRWHFAHDTYEEYFLSSYIYTCIETDDIIPDLNLWKTNETQIQLFSGVIEFIKDFGDQNISQRLIRSKIPALWKKILRESV